jgi:hypothetical protein
MSGNVKFIWRRSWEIESFSFDKIEVFRLVDRFTEILSVNRVANKIIKKINLKLPEIFIFVIHLGEQFKI